MLACALIVVGALSLSLSLLKVGIVGLVLSVAAQGRGHRLEAVPPEPFTGVTNFLARLFAEH